jgi:hypothetical protein
MEKRKVDQEEFAATFLCAPAIPLYTSTTFAVDRRTSSQSAPDRNTGGTPRSTQSPCTSKRETVAGVLFGSYTMVGSQSNERYPDFKHKTQEALWLQDRRNPPWVAAEIAAMAPGTVQLNIFTWNGSLQNM